MNLFFGEISNLRNWNLSRFKWQVNEGDNCRFMRVMLAGLHSIVTTPISIISLESTPQLDPFTAVFRNVTQHSS